MEAENQIKGLIAEKTGAEPANITVDSYFEDDLNIGELELVEILGDIEEILEIEGLIESKKSILTVGDLMDLVTEKTE
jgi:acyl carrier protein